MMLHRRLLLASLPRAAERLDELVALRQPELVEAFNEAVRRLYAAGVFVPSPERPLSELSRHDQAYVVLELEFGAMSDVELIVRTLRAVVAAQCDDTAKTDDDAFQAGYRAATNRMTLLLDSLLPLRDVDQVIAADG